MRHVEVRFLWDFMKEESAWEAAYYSLVSGYLSGNELNKTVKRAAKSWGELLNGYNVLLSDFSKALYPKKGDGIVVVRCIKFVSVCEHHLLPILGECSVGYLPGEKIIGLSKIPRIVDMYARRLQLQERLTEQIASGVMQVVKAKGVGVRITAQHLCMIARGVEQQQSLVITESYLGNFSQKENRDAFINLLK